MRTVKQVGRERSCKTCFAFVSFIRSFIDPFNASCSKLLLSEGSSAILV